MSFYDKFTKMQRYAKDIIESLNKIMKFSVSLRTAFSENSYYKNIVKMEQ